MRIISFECGPVATNAYLVFKEERSAAVIIDAPMDSIEPLAEAAGEEGVEPAALILTHTHWDHTADAAKMKRRWPDMIVYVHPDDEYRLVEPMKHSVWPLPFTIEPLNADRHLHAGDRFELEGIEFDVIHTPGHTEGGICLLEKNEGVVFVGDTLFAGSVGRTDLPGGDWGTLLNSIRARLLTLPASTTVYPGHGPATTIGQEREANPFLG